MTYPHSASYDTIVSSENPSQSLPQMIQNISLPSTPLTAIEHNDYLPHNPSHPRDHILPAPELLSMIAAERDGITPGLYPISFPAGISLQSNAPRNPLGFHQSGYWTHSHSSDVDYNLARFRHSIQPTATFQEYATSQGLTMLDGIADRTIDSTLSAASSYPIAPSMQALPTLRRAHSLEEFSSAASPMSHYSRADNMIPCDGYHYASHSFSSTSLMPDSFPLHTLEEYDYLSSSAPSTQMIYEGGSGSNDPSPATASAAIYSSSFPTRTWTPSFSPSPSCNSPALSTNSPLLDMRQISLGTMSPSDGNDSDCNNSIELGSDPKKRKMKQKKKKEEGRPMSSSSSSQEERFFVCKLNNCKRKFLRHYNLKSHEFTHDVQRPHACHHCSKTFARVHDRDRHMNSHMTEKPHVCIVCLSRFGRQDAVIRHLKLSNETNACSRMLKQKGITFREAAAGRVPREQLGEEMEIRQRLETLEEEARKIRAKKTLESLNYGSGGGGGGTASWSADLN
ncbi:hypothetical protein EC968_006938 [Mortierella alpina]|nr:hypothetical protein EC968_006938 [Mortierella alpina]